MIDVNDLVGKPFSDGGRGPGSYDCWGLVQEVYRRFGMNLPDYSISATACQQVHQEIDQAKGSQHWIELSTPEVPCVVLIKAHPGFYQHLGVYFGHGKFLHVMNYGVEMARRNDPLWKKRVKGYWQYAPYHHT